MEVDGDHVWAEVLLYSPLIQEVNSKEQDGIIAEVQHAPLGHRIISSLDIVAVYLRTAHLIIGKEFSHSLPED